MKLNWNYPTTIWVGENRINDLREACKNLNITKPLLVTDKDLINLRFIKNVISERCQFFDSIHFRPCQVPSDGFLRKFSRKS